MSDRIRKGHLRQRIHIHIEGIVQGVGFRPFLHRLAEEHGICGWVRNTSAGLEGILEGETAELSLFLTELKASPPPMAQIEAIRTENIDTSSNTTQHTGTFDRFTIRESRIRTGSTLISPDITMCPECEAELYDPSDRRYRYPFINCTNCGPRYTIIESLPYDRERTVMKEFLMCQDCADEYSDIHDRRYHAQPDCCPDCGPEVFYTDSTAGTHARSISGDDTFLRSQELLAGGGILAVKGIGGIHLACDALNPDAVLRLRRRKHRAEKPLALMCRSLDAVRRICEITPVEERLLSDPARPIVLLAKKKTVSDSQTARALDILSFSPRLGVMLPYTPLHTLLLDGTYGGPDILVMTSGNVPGCPVLTDNEAALSALADVADGFLLHNRRIANRCDDSLIAEWQGRPYFLRRSRGYAPRPIRLNIPVRTPPDGIPADAGTGPACTGCPPADVDGIFALGAEQKASFALGRGSYAFLSPYIGDLKNAETSEHYTGAMKTYEKLFHLRPSIFVCDLHPDYLSTREAKRRSEQEHVPLMQVQHHWAHMASCMADNGLNGSCFGIIWDGTGLGTDRNIWGGEFLTGDLESFQRAGSIRPVLLPGGDRAVREIGRIALSLAKDTELSDLSCVPLPEGKRRMLSSLIDMSPSSLPAASSIGRLFDGVCALILGRSEIDYEGEGAALVEAVSPVETPNLISKELYNRILPEREQNSRCQPPASLQELAWPVTFYEEDGLRIFDTRPVIRSIAAELSRPHEKERNGILALRFMATLICMAADQCMALNPDRLPVVLSGGVFQNRFLLHGITSLLESSGFSVYTHHQVSTNDEGVALGQLAIARHRQKLSGAGSAVQPSDHYKREKGA